MKVTVEALRDAYQSTGSVWKAGEILGMTGQMVAYYMKKNGIERTTNPQLTKEDKDAIRQYYATTSEDHFDLDDLARQMGRSKQLICRHARRLGLTDQKRPASKECRDSIKARSQDMWKDKPHPRGYLGHKHNGETLKKISDAGKLSWSTAKAFGISHMAEETRNRKSAASALAASKRPAHKNYTKGAGGRRADLGETYFRSSWEANYARYLNLLMKMGVVETWEFEPETFWFKNIQRGVRSYLPDFKVKYRSDPTPVFVEVKGWVMAKDKTKWKRMKKYYPHIKLEIVGAKEYRAIKAKWSSAIPQWENGKKLTIKPLETTDALD